MKTTDAHFRIFEREARRWIKRCGLEGWGTLDVLHKDLKGKRAQCSTNLRKRVAYVALAKDWGNDTITEAGLRAAAKHEVMHIVLAPITDLGDERFLDGADYYAAVEHVCNHVSSLVR